MGKCANDLNANLGAGADEAIPNMAIGNYDERDAKPVAEDEGSFISNAVIGTYDERDAKPVAEDEGNFIPNMAIGKYDETDAHPAE